MNLEENSLHCLDESKTRDKMDRLIQNILPNYTCDDDHSNTHVINLRYGVEGFPISIVIPLKIIDVKNRGCYQDAVRLASRYNLMNCDPSTHFSVRESYQIELNTFK